MQMQVNNSTPTQSFGSTRILIKKLHPRTAFTEITDTLDRYFEVKGFGNASDVFVKNPQKVADQIDSSKAAITIDNGDLIIIGKEGGKGGADTFIGRIMKEKFGDAAVFKDDIAPLKLDKPSFDMTKIKQ